MLRHLQDQGTEVRRPCKPLDVCFCAVELFCVSNAFDDHTLSLKLMLQSSKTDTAGQCAEAYFSKIVDTVLQHNLQSHTCYNLKSTAGAIQQ